MTIPDSLTQVAIFVLIVMPGVTFATVRTALSGWKSPDYGTSARLMEAVFVSVLFCGVYAIAFAGVLSRNLNAMPPSASIVTPGTAGLAVVLFIAAPALVAAAISVKVVRYEDPRGKTRVRVIKRNGYRGTPQAWDGKVLHMDQGSFVRIRRADGTYFGGWYSTRSMASTYPRPRDIYIESQWKMKGDGAFDGKIAGTRGVWLAVTDTCVVEWLDVPTSTEI